MRIRNRVDRFQFERKSAKKEKSGKIHQFTMFFFRFIVDISNNNPHKHNHMKNMNIKGMRIKIKMYIEFTQTIYHYSRQFTRITDVAKRRGI